MLRLGLSLSKPTVSKPRERLLQRILDCMGRALVSIRWFRYAFGYSTQAATRPAALNLMTLSYH